MSVQNGRCVVTFNQNNQEVVKGVADYLRYAGEERIKKWRRHVRMVGEYPLSFSTQDPATTASGRAFHWDCVVQLHTQQLCNLCNHTNAVR